MNSDDPRAHDDESQDEPQIVVEDPEEFAKTRQLRAIFDSRDDYIQARRDASAAYENGDMSFANMNRYIFRYMQDFAMAAEPLLSAHDEGKELWQQQRYGTDSNFVEQGELASFDDGFKLFHEAAKQIVEDGVSEQHVRILTDSFNIDLTRGEMSRVLGSIKPNQQQQHHSRPTLKLPGETPNDISDVIGRLRAVVEQTEQPRSKQQQSKSPAVDAFDLVKAVQKVKEGDGLAMSHKKDKFRHKLRVRATDWGWQTTGIGSLTDGLTPKLVYPKSRDPEFGLTAPPEVVTNSVFRDIQMFLDDIGLGVEFDEGQQTKIDDGLLEEVDEWRRQNV